jgi:hypothetical protein
MPECTSTNAASSGVLDVGLATGAVGALPSDGNSKRDEIIGERNVIKGKLKYWAGLLAGSVNKWRQQCHRYHRRPKNDHPGTPT